MKIQAALFALLLAPAAIVQQPSTAPATVQPFVLEAGPLALPDLIDRCAEYLGRNILCSPQELAGQASGQGLRLQHRIETYSDGCEELLTHLLYTQGLVLTTLDEDLQMYEVISMNGPRGREALTRVQQRTPEQILARPRLKVPVLTTIPLKFINATIATNALRPFFASAGPAIPTSVSFGNIGTANALLITGMQDQVAQAILVIRACDVEAAQNADAQTGPLQRELRELEQRIAAIEKKLASLGAAK